MIDEAKIQSVYKYIDKNGIPIKSILAKIGVTISLENPYDKIFLEKEKLIANKVVSRELVFGLPFDLSQKEQEDIVLKYIYDTTGYKFSNPHSLLDYPNINGLPFLLFLNEHDENRKISLGKNIIPGSLFIRSKYCNYGFKTLGTIEHIQGSLGLDSIMDDLGNLKRVDDDIWFSNHVGEHKLKTLSPLEYVGGNLNMKWTKASLGTLKKIGGNLNLRKTHVTDLGSLEYVGGNVLYSKINEEYYAFSKITIKGAIKGFNDKF